ncbi:MAG: hypothetical protein JNM50_07715 [Chromatiales bacterium]|jgi:hypothetical protein|nr:hypothetical protein [Chromatiales bacterium]
MDYARLKARQRAERSGHPPNLAIRVHRALSWLDRAEQAERLPKPTKERSGSRGVRKERCDDLDARFLFLWISFNAAYATEIDETHQLSQQATFRRFIGKLVDLDRDGLIANLVWSEFPGSIRVLLDNPYVCAEFWAWRNGRITEQQWLRAFAAARRAAKAALARHDTARVLGIVMSRIYTLRNQLIHGGATWEGDVNRDQVRDCTRLMGRLVPIVIEIMLDHPGTLWGDACYPVVDLPPGPPPAA